VVIRTCVDEISVFGRDTQGVRLMKIEEGTKVVCVEKIVEEEDEEEAAVPEEADNDTGENDPSPDSI
jgi:DNA gyrase subunit A